MGKEEKIQEVIDKLFYPNCFHCLYRKYGMDEERSSLTNPYTVSSAVQEICTKHLLVAENVLKANLRKTRLVKPFHKFYRAKLKAVEQELLSRKETQ